MQKPARYPLRVDHGSIINIYWLGPFPTFFKFGSLRYQKTCIPCCCNLSSWKTFRLNFYNRDSSRVYNCFMVCKIFPKNYWKMKNRYCWMSMLNYCNDLPYWVLCRYPCSISSQTLNFSSFFQIDFKSSQVFVEKNLIFCERVFVFCFWHSGEAN